MHPINNFVTEARTVTLRCRTTWSQHHGVKRVHLLFYASRLHSVDCALRFVGFIGIVYILSQAVGAVDGGPPRPFLLYPSVGTQALRG